MKIGVGLFDSFRMKSLRRLICPSDSFLSVNEEPDHEAAASDDCRAGNNTSNDHKTLKLTVLALKLALQAVKLACHFFKSGLHRRIRFSDLFFKLGFAFLVCRFKCRLGVLKCLAQGLKLGCGILLACLDRFFKLCLNVLKLLG